MNDPNYQKSYRKKHKKKLREYNLKYKEVNKETIKKQRKEYTERERFKIARRVRANKLRARYGMSEDQYNLLLALQEAVCAICGAQHTQDRMLAVDHDHQTGQVRGLLCGNCNRAIGLFRDSTENLKNAIKYLYDSRDNNNQARG